MNLYCDLTTLKSSSVADFASVTTHDAFLLALLEAASRAIDVYCSRRFYCYSGTKYYNGADQVLFLDDVLSITTFKTDEDQDGTYEESWTANEDYQLYPINEYPKTWAEISSRITREYADFNKGVHKGVEIVGIWGYGDGKSTTPYKTSGTTTNEELDSSETAVDVAAGTALAAGQTILVESEQMYIESISTNTMTVVRNVNGTTAATHATGKAVSITKYPEAITIATIMQTLRWWKRRESAFQTSVQTDIGSINVYRGLDPDISLICNQYKLVNI